jgi:hypothetical protein
MRAAVLILLVTAVVVCMRVLALGEHAMVADVFSPAVTRTSFRVLAVVFGLAAWFMSQSLIGARGQSQTGIGDAVHDWTVSWHGALARNRRAANALLITSSAFIDLFGVFLIGSSLVGPTFRPGVALLIVFAFRQISQLMCTLPAPPGMIWHRPGVSSLFVTYDVANDFFFSGHTAIAVLGAIEIAQIAPPWLGIAAAVVAVLEALAVLVLRAHYTMDVLTGAVAAFCAAGLAQMICTGF